MIIMGKNIGKNYLYNLIYQILLIISPLITTPYISRVLEPDGVGLYSYTNAIVSYFILFATMGITIYGQREISYVQDNKDKRSQVFWNVKLLSIVNVCIWLIIYYIYIYYFSNNIYIYLIWGIAIVNISVDITWFFQGLEEFKKIVIRNCFVKILDIIYIFIFVRTKEDIYLYIFGIVIFQLLGNVILWKNIFKYIDKPILKNLKPFKDISTVLSLFIPTIAIQIYIVLDKIMIGYFTNDFLENGYYEQATKISKLVLTIVISLGVVMVPRIGYLFEKKQMDNVKEYMYKSYRFVWCLSLPLSIGLICISDNIVPWFFGIEYAKVSEVLKISSLLIIFIGINNITGIQYLIPTKRQNIFTKTVIVGAIVNIICNFIFIPKLYAIGAAISSVIAEAIIAICQLIIVKKELDLFTIVKYAKNYIIASLIMGLILFFEQQFFLPNIVNSFIMIITGVISYVLILIYLKDRFFLSNIKKVKF